MGGGVVAIGSLVIAIFAVGVDEEAIGEGVGNAFGQGW